MIIGLLQSWLLPWLVRIDNIIKDIVFLLLFIGLICWLKNFSLFAIIFRLFFLLSLLFLRKVFCCDIIIFILVEYFIEWLPNIICILQSGLSGVSVLIEYAQLSRGITVIRTINTVVLLLFQNICLKLMFRIFLKLKLNLFPFKGRCWTLTIEVIWKSETIMPKTWLCIAFASNNVLCLVWHLRCVK